MSDSAHGHALLVAAALDEQPDQVDPAEAGAAGLAHLDVLLEEGGATQETEELGVRLLSFATSGLPSHPSAPLWRYRAGGALSYLAEVLDSVPHLDAAIAFLTDATSTAQPSLAEQAAVDCAELIRLRLTVSEDLAAADARKWTADVAALAEYVHTPAELLDFRRERALAHRWAYPHTLDPEDLDHALAGLEAVLPFDTDNRALLLETIALLLEERYRLTTDPAALTSALAAARELVELVGSAEALVLLAGLLATARFAELDVEVDEAIDAYAAVPSDLLDAEHTINYGVLLCVRGATTSGAADLLAGTSLLTPIASEPDFEFLPVLLVLAESFLVLSRLDGPDHLWPALDWASAAIAADTSCTDSTTLTRSWRLEAVEAAAKSFGIRTVLEQYDVRGFLAEAERVVRDGDAELDPEVRAFLVMRIVSIRTQWLMDVAPLGEHPDVTLRNLRSLVADTSPYLSAEVGDRLNGVVSTIDAATRYAVTGATPELAVFEQMLAGLDDGSELDAVGELEIDLVRLLNRIVTDPRQETVRAHLSRVTSLAWRVDTLPDDERKRGLTQMISLLSRMAGPPSGSLAELMGGTELGGLLTQTRAWQSASSSGDVQEALRAYEAVARTESSARPDSGLEMAARMLRGVYRAHLGSSIPTDPESLDSAIAELETAFAQEPSGATGLALGSRLRLRDRPGDRTASRVAGLAAAGVAGDQVTAWCLDDGAGEDLVRVLEARRRSLLGLETGGQKDAAWSPLGQETGPAVHNGPSEDVLIYLVPGCDAHDGVAATVTPDGAIEVVPLPGLRTHAIRAWREALEKARVTPSWRGWTDNLARIGEWAWAAAGEAFAPWRGKRLALVPMGGLGLVPWAAAWHEQGGERRYLVQDNEITFLPAATTPQGATGDGALFVGNPDRTNGDAATIAEGLRTAFHPRAEFLGGHGGPPRPWRESPQGRGTPEEVLAAVRNGLGVLHLGCRTTSGPAGSTISLHGGDLAVAELLPARIGLVTLTDHVSAEVDDDALAVPSQLVAHGTRSVLAALWPAPSGALLHLVHHHLGDGLTPSAALRAAQLQMLDPGRVLPGNTPADLPLDPAGAEHWAVLAHHGR